MYGGNTLKQNGNRGDEPIGYTVEGVLALAGGRQAVAKKLGLTVQSVAKWGRRIPSKHAREVAILAGLPLAVVRPDHVQETAE
jgi:hypothetical protein